MLRVGLTGGLASGKSFVGRALEDLGCYVIRADDLGHAVLNPGGEAYEAVIGEFGSSIISADSSDKSIDRRHLASIVFKDPARLAKLNSLVHPAVRLRSQALLNDYETRYPHGIAVYEAAILIEAGRYREFTRLIVAVCSMEQQIERAMARDGTSRDEVMERLSRQMPLEDKIEYADYVIDTSGSKENTTAQVHTLYKSLSGLNL